MATTTETLHGFRLDRLEEDFGKLEERVSELRSFVDLQESTLERAFVGIANELAPENNKDGPPPEWLKDWRASVGY